MFESSFWKFCGGMILLTPWTRLAAFLSLILLCSFSSNAQTPSPAASALTREDNAGFYPGLMLGTPFEGSTSCDASVFDLGTGVAYIFSHRFGIDLGVPYFFVGTPTSIK